MNSFHFYLSEKVFVSLSFWEWVHPAACGILVLQPGIKPAPPAVEARGLNHQPTKEVPLLHFWRIILLEIELQVGGLFLWTFRYSISLFLLAFWREVWCTSNPFCSLDKVSFTSCFFQNFLFFSSLNMKCVGVVFEILFLLGVFWAS